MEYKYPAILVQQTNAEKRLLMFGAPAAEIARWAGIPQKKRFGSEETIGFQREENPARIKSLRTFFGDADNIIQNPLLCASRTAGDAPITFQRTSDGDERGEIVLNTPDFDEMSFQDILGRVRSYLETRVPELARQSPRQALIDILKEQAIREGHLDVAESETATEDTEDDDESDSTEDSEENMTSVLFDESHIADFWEEVAARYEIARLIPEPIKAPSFLEFSRDALLSYILPVVLVDGQHRLRGALAAAHARLETDQLRNEIEKRVALGEDATTIEQDLLVRESRRLPVSLLLSADPSEQVFQFVIVNQKATPVGRALLGTIVSTTLSNEEMGRVATRLKNAGVKLEESQAITYLARHPGSPFFNKVERGLASNGNEQDVLQWSVFASLVSIFRYLKDGKLFGEKNDYARVWCSKYLPSSPIVAGHENPFEYWSRIDGPWREVFVKFWTEVRTFFGDLTDPERPNYWGRPRTSNLFNKISLTILAADFFQFLVEQKRTISSADEIPDIVRDWLDGVNPGYFSKDWILGGVKKDSTGIRNQWASLWSQYRKNPEQLPQARSFRIPKVV